MRYLQYEINGVTKSRPITLNVSAAEIYKILKAREEISKLSPALKPEVYSNFKVINN